MDISNFSSIFEVFFGLNIISSLVDRFSFSKDFASILKPYNALTQLNFLFKKLEFKEEAFRKQGDIYQIGRTLDYLNWQEETGTFYLKFLNLKVRFDSLFITKNFSSICFFTSLFCLYHLMLIAVESNIGDHYLSSLILLSSFTILHTIFFFFLECFNKAPKYFIQTGSSDSKDIESFSEQAPAFGTLFVVTAIFQNILKRSPIVTTLSFFIGGIILSLLLSKLLFHFQWIFDFVHKPSIAVLLILTPVLHYILYFARLLFVGHQMMPEIIEIRENLNRIFFHFDQFEQAVQHHKMVKAAQPNQIV